MQHADVDFLVLGSGIAGLYAALVAAQQGSTCVLTKGPIEESNTKYAQGGIAAAVGPGDSTSLHFEDTLTAGAGLCDRDAVAIMVREAPDRIGRLTALGVPFDAQDGAVSLGREGAHSAARILHAGGDRTGNAIETVMVERVQAAGISVLDRHLATELLVEDGRVCGVQARDPQGAAVTVRSRWTVLATGGAGRLYTLTTNPAVATGDGMALAYRAGAALRDLEFVQFHPTALRIPDAPPFLISEALRGEGAILRRPDGTRFMPAYDARADLAPRDVVARAVATEMAAAGSDHVLLDISHREAAFVAARFPGIYQYCLRYELDLTREPLPVAPAAHYFMGGVLTDTWGRTTLPGLLACGEVASSGVHGANRLASNSLLETVVFAQRAVEAAMDGAEAAPAPADTQSLPIDLGIAAPDQESLQRLLWDHAGIVRDAAGLRAASGVIDGWRPAPATADAPPVLRNIALLGRLIVEAALQRRESRGTHYRADFPETRDAWRRHLTFRRATADTH